MFEKLKRHVLVVVALVLGWSAWSGAQTGDNAPAMPDVPEPLPEVDRDALRQRLAGESLRDLLDPFRLRARLDARDLAQADDAGTGAPIQDAEQEQAVILELESVMRFSGDSRAFLAGRPYRVGEQVPVSADHAPLEVVSIDGSRVAVRYLDEVYTLDVYERPRIQVGRSQATLRAATGAEGADEAPAPVQSDG